MKRYLCPEHIYYLKKQGKAIVLNSDMCTICRYHKRPMTLKDMASKLENIASNMRFAHDNPNYDPFGITWFQDLETCLIKFLKSIHFGYRDTFLESLNKTFENRPKEMKVTMQTNISKEEIK